MFKRLFNIFRRKKEDDDEYFSEYDEEELGLNISEDNPKISYDEMSIPLKGRINYKDKDARLCLIRDCCDQIVTAGKHVDETRKEYAIVTEYINDVQVVRTLPLGKKNELISKALNITSIMKEKENFKKTVNAKISDKQYTSIQPYEDIMPEEIQKLREYEKYQIVIEDDMRKLEGERGSLKYEHRKIVRQQEFLKLMMTATLMILIMLSCLYLCINKVTGADVMMIFLVTVFVAAIIAFYAAVKGNNNKKTSKMNAAKMNRLVELVNKTKIKYVNNKNIIEYMCTKYSAKNSMELNYLWEQYIIRKKAEENFVRNAKLMDSYSNSVVLELDKLGVNDSGIWLNQLDAIIDDNKAEQIEKRLLKRREKLKNNIDYNNKLIKMGMDEIKKVISINSDYRIEVIAILKRYGISIN